MTSETWRGFAPLLLLALVACQSGEAKPGDAKSDGGDDEEVAVPVEVAKVTRGAIDASYRGTATLEAVDEATVVAKTPGVVEAVAVAEGDRVAAGDVLARVETERLELEVERAKATLNQLRQDFKRNKSLFAQNLISREVYDRSRYETEAAEAAWEIARLSLREATIRAPFDGVVSTRHIKRGNMVRVNDPAFRVTRLDTLEAQVFVPERDIYKLAIGHPADLTVEGWPDDRFTGTVARINPVVDPATGTVKVVVAVSDSSGKLKPGMFGRVQIRYDRRDNAVLVDKDAVLVEDGAESLFVVTDEGRARRRSIRTGYADADHYEVLEGLSAGDRVVITGQNNLKDDTKVDIVPTLVAGADADADAEGATDAEGDTP